VLFFKEIKKEKLANPGFNAFYAQECHICSLTLNVIEIMESSTDKTQILNQLNIPGTDYELLKKGDHCRPGQVRRLCNHLGIQTDDESVCPRFKDASK